MIGIVKYLYIDTNGFLQLRDLKDLPWKELFPDTSEIDLLVAPAIIDELDQFKTSTNERRRKRSRQALQLIDSASENDGLALTIRDTPIKVRIVISTAPPINWNAFPSLDQSRADDQLVAEAKSFGKGAAVLSHDSGPRIRARVAGVDAIKPPDEWLLPEEQTDDQRKVSQLTRDLDRALSTRPRIVAGFDHFEEETGTVRVILPVLPQIDPGLAEELSKKYLSKHKRERLRREGRNNSLMISIGGYSDYEIDEYNREYGKFESGVRDYYRNLHLTVANLGLVAAIGYFVRNESGVEANGLRIEFTLTGAGSLLSNRDVVSGLVGSFELPEPPERPRSQLDMIRDVGIYNIPSLRDHLTPRDPIEFYWFEEPEEIPSLHSAKQSESFRAMREYRDSALVFASPEYPTTLELWLHVSAANLPAPVDAHAKLIFDKQNMKWSDPLVQALISKDLHGIEL
ncbi:MAG TPA: PIN domain-containing protein [Rhizomicrobium sp.]